MPWFASDYVSMMPRIVCRRDRAQVAVERDVLVRLPRYRRGKEPDLLEHPCEASRFRARDSLSAAAATSSRC